MGKYTDQQKVAVAQDYCSGTAGLRAVAQRHGVNVSSLRKWAAAFRENGAAGVHTKKRETYSAEFKLSVVLRKRAEQLSERQAAAVFDIRNFNIIRVWERAYDEGGKGALEPYNPGMQKKKSAIVAGVEKAKMQSDAARSKEDLLAELNQLRMENAYLKKGRCLGSEKADLSAAEKALIISELRQHYPLSGLLKFARLARSTFYYRTQIAQVKDRHADIKAKIQAVFARHKGRYGYRRITAAIRREGSIVNHKTVQRLMGELKLKSLVRIKKYRAYMGEIGEVAPDVLKRDFKAKRPNEKWVTDVTEFKVGDQRLYLSPILDLYNGEIVSYKVARRPLFNMVEAMLEQAWPRLKRRDRPILHSDQGWQYRMPIYRRSLKQHSITQSMSRRGNCLDNAAMESFFGTLKSEFYHLNSFQDVDELQQGIDEYIRYY
ncbi:IS3 family transposase, partial [Robbsia andropogonis]|uniref:IS3 family transposase n=1 Tax=Robbsia andropogonis TaxID=28092 RepID=UPI0020A15436|nr:IS3 family transposase [Robbsia andropogonis]MCP1131510.1 IS3 family transposase [Robbsia andropogonis]